MLLVVLIPLATALPIKFIARTDNSYVGSQSVYPDTDAVLAKRQNDEENWSTSEGGHKLEHDAESENYEETSGGNSESKEDNQVDESEKNEEISRDGGDSESNKTDQVEESNKNDESSEEGVDSESKGVTQGDDLEHDYEDEQYQDDYVEHDYEDEQHQDDYVEHDYEDEQYQDDYIEHDYEDEQYQDDYLENDIDNEYDFDFDAFLDDEIFEGYHDEGEGSNQVVLGDDYGMKDGL
jgi:hypothetical protein